MTREAILAALRGARPCSRHADLRPNFPACSGCHEARADAVLAAIQPRVSRCLVTRNPCGIDTWAAGSSCPCAECQAYLAGKADRDALAAAQARAERLATLVRDFAHSCACPEGVRPCRPFMHNDRACTTIAAALLQDDTAALDAALAQARTEGEIAARQGWCLLLMTRGAPPHDAGVSEAAMLDAALRKARADALAVGADAVQAFTEITPARAASYLRLLANAAGEGLDIAEYAARLRRMADDAEAGR